MWGKKDSVLTCLGDRADCANEFNIASELTMDCAAQLAAQGGSNKTCTLVSGFFSNGTAFPDPCGNVVKYLDYKTVCAQSPTMAPPAPTPAPPPTEPSVLPPTPVSYQYTSSQCEFTGSRIALDCRLGGSTATEAYVWNILVNRVYYAEDAACAADCAADSALSVRPYNDCDGDCTMGTGEAVVHQQNSAQWVSFIEQRCGGQIVSTGHCNAINWNSWFVAGINNCKHTGGKRAIVEFTCIPYVAP